VTRLSQQQCERLLTLLREERELMARFVELTEEQAGLIAAADDDALASSFVAGGSISEEFKRLRAESESLAAIYRGSDERSGEIDGLIAEIDALSGRAATKNSENVEAARVRLVELGSQMSTLSQNRKGVIGYASVGAYGVSELFDKMT
jgi:hypothetical protein